MLMMHDRTLSAIDLNLLVILRALLRERHVTRAAARIGLSQSATSHALARLRELYGDSLLVRSGRSLTLTPRAARLLPLLERGLGELESAVTGEPEFEPRTARRTFTLGTSDYLQALLLGPLLQKLERCAPRIDLAAVIFPNLREQLETGAIDLALGVSLPELRGMREARLFDDEFVCMVRRNHPRLGRRPTLAKYLAERHVVVAPGGTAGSTVDSVLERQRRERRIALRVTNFLMAPVVVCQTDFVNTMPARLARQLAKTYPLRLFAPPFALPAFSYDMFWHPRLEHDPAQRWLRSFVADVSKAC